MVVQLIGLVGEALGQTLGARVALCFRHDDLIAMEKVLADNIRRAALLSAPIFAAVLFWGDRIDLVLGPSFAVDFAVVAVVAARMFLQTIFRYSGFALSMTGWHLRETALLGSGWAQPSASSTGRCVGLNMEQARRERRGAADLCQSLGTPANNGIQKFIDQNTVPQLFVATGAAVALKNHWGDKAFVRVIFDQPINHFGYDQSHESEARGYSDLCTPKEHRS